VLKPDRASTRYGNYIVYSLAVASCISASCAWMLVRLGAVADGFALTQMSAVGSVTFTPSGVRPWKVDIYSTRQPASSSAKPMTTAHAPHSLPISDLSWSSVLLISPYRRRSRGPSPMLATLFGLVLGTLILLAGWLL
jgi:hypothetical protein